MDTLDKKLNLVLDRIELLNNKLGSVQIEQKCIKQKIDRCDADTFLKIRELLEKAGPSSITKNEPLRPAPAANIEDLDKICSHELIVSPKCIHS